MEGRRREEVVGRNGKGGGRSNKKTERKEELQKGSEAEQVVCFLESAVQRQGVD